MLSTPEISIEEAAQRVVDAVPEVASFERQGEYLRFNFDHPRRVRRQGVVSASATIYIGNNTMVDDGSERDLIRRLRKMLRVR
jgi:hypothetical protein